MPSTFKVKPGEFKVVGKASRLIKNFAPETLSWPRFKMVKLSLLGTILLVVVTLRLNENTEAGFWVMLFIEILNAVTSDNARKLLALFTVNTPPMATIPEMSISLVRISLLYLSLMAPISGGPVEKISMTK